MSPIFSGARGLIEALRIEGVEVVFGIPGGAIMPVYDELLGSPIRHVLARHEQSAAHMADGYARVTGRPGVAMATSGPGATNLVTGVATAYMDSVPMVAITGQVATRLIGTDAFQEIDTVGIFNPITKYQFQPRRPSEVPRAVKAAFYLTATGRTSPVLIDLPKDVQMEKEEMAFPESVDIPGYRAEYEPDPLHVAKAADLLLAADRPVLLGGGGVIKSNACDLLVAVAELLNIPVATTLMGKGCIPENHPLSLGPIGMHGTYHANKLIMESDLVICVGARFSDRSTMNLSEFTKDRKIIHFDAHSSEIGKNLKPHHYVVGNIRKSLRILLEVLKVKAVKCENTAWRGRWMELKSEYEDAIFGASGEFTSPRIIRKIRDMLPIDAIVTTEVGQHQMWAELHYRVLKPRTFLTSGGLGTMGFGFPAAIGAKTAKPWVPVLDIAGDGSFLMTSDSLATSVQENLPVIVCVFNNSCLGMVAQWQRAFYGGRYSGVWLGSKPDFVNLAKSYGAEGVRVNGMLDFERALREALKSEVTTVIDIPISPEENVLPFVPTGSGLNEMIVK
ncbi:acetolactate synthase, large subunit, biosynthetic type [Candidatus Marsarchaeota G2 archaeon OSP_D]|uniref:Acetolactate synthase n=1 Tax=Candidatus Marsarchaeota G2 archaeon OSP_D TaxID=1978157 RepID=A0A2R6AUB3_9ARCH|nr:MAG: acetolactate synthase, large subunit, biosynthetic type [Candidatus Marsarchaeota G2 archaeon OSP_D]